MRLSKLFGKQVYSIYEGEIVGTISGAVFSESQKKITAFKIFDQEENEYELIIANIKAMTDCILITNKNKLYIFASQTTKTPMFKEVIDENGKHCGKITDIEIKDNGEILNFITQQNLFLEPSKVYMRKNFVYYCTTPVKISAFKPRTKKVQSLSQIKVNILNINEQDNFLPKKVQYNPETIIGKMAKNDLLGINNEIIVKANQTITEKTITDASRHNRLNQLYYIAI